MGTTPYLLPLESLLWDWLLAASSTTGKVGSSYPNQRLLDLGGPLCLCACGHFFFLLLIFFCCFFFVVFFLYFFFRAFLYFFSCRFPLFFFLCFRVFLSFFFVLYLFFLFVCALRCDLFFLLAVFPSSSPPCMCLTLYTFCVPTTAVLTSCFET